MSENTKMVAELGSSRPMQVRSSFRRSAQGREIVIVLGMHRSGTSLLANVLHLLGVDMVDEPTHTSPSNEKGFWERQDIRAIQDEILAVLGVPVGSTAHAVPFAAGWWRSVEIRKLKEQLRDLLAAHLSRVRRPWGFKDPRTCRLLPLWGEILEELDISPRFVWAVRHPAESAMSMTMKNPVHRPIPIAQSEVMWLAYNYDILRHAGRHWPIIVPFDQWFEDPLAQARELARELDLVWQGSDHELQSALDHLVSGEHRHHFASQGKLRCNLAISEEIYRGILGLGNGASSEVSEAAAVSLHSLLAAVQPFAIAAQDAKSLREENQALAGEIGLLRTAAAEHGKLQVSLAEVTAERNEVQEQLAFAQAAGDALQQDHAATLRKLDGFRNQLAAVTAAKEAAEASLADAISTMIAERDGLRAQLASATAAEETLRQDHAATVRKLNGFRSQLVDATAAREMAETSLAATIADMEGRYGEMKAAAALEADALKDEILKLARDAEQIRADATELRLNLADISGERDHLGAQLVSAMAAEAALHKDHVAVFKEMDAFRSQVAAVNALKDQAEASLASARVEIEQIKSVQAEEASASAALESDLAAAAAANNSLQAELASMSGSAAALEREISVLNEEMAAMRVKLRDERERHAEAFHALLLRSKSTGQEALAATWTMDT